MLVITLLQAIRLLHPMAPFITEELFQLLKERFDGPCFAKDPYTIEASKALLAKGCIVSNYPEPIEAFTSKEVEAKFDLLSKLVYTIRNIRGEMKVPVGIPCDAIIIGKESDPEFILAKEHAYVINALVKNKSLTFCEEKPTSSGSKAMINSLELWVTYSKRDERTRAKLAS